MVRNIFLGSASSFVVSFMTLVFAARMFPLQFVSDLKMVSLYGGLFSTVLTFQTHSAFLYFYSDKRPVSFEVFSFALMGACACIAGMSFYIFFPFVYEGNTINGTGLACFSIYVACNSFFIMSPAAYTAKGDCRYLPRFMLSFSVCILCALLAGYILDLGINEFSAIQCVLLMVVVFASRWRKYAMSLFGRGVVFGFNAQPFFLWYAAKLTLSNVIESMGDKADKIVAGKVFSTMIFAKYAVLSFENPLVNVLLNSFGLSLINEFSSRFSDSRSSFFSRWNETVKIITFITYPMAAVVFFYSEPIITLVFGANYLDAALILEIYSLVSLVRPAPFQVLLKMTGLVKYNIYISLGFLMAAIFSSMVVVVSDLPYHYLALSYVFGWVVFNSCAIYFFCTIKNEAVKSVVPLSVLIWRFISSFGLCYLCSQLISNTASGFLVFFVMYFVLNLRFDRFICDKTFQLIKFEIK